MVTPSGLANAFRCSTEVIAASSLFSSNSSPPTADVLDQEAERNLFGDLDGSLDLVHGLDARERDPVKRC